MISGNTKKDVDFEKVLVEKWGMFTPNTWQEIKEKTLSLQEVVYRDIRLVEIWFHMDDHHEGFSSTFWEEIRRFFKDKEHQKHILLQFDRISWGYASLVRILSGIIGYRVDLTLINGRHISIFAESQKMHSAIEENLDLFKFVLQFVFNIKKVSVTIEQCFDLFAPKKKRSTEKVDVKDDNAYCCFKLEVRTDLSGKNKYKVGIGNSNRFLWLSIANRKGEEGAADALFKKLTVNKWYKCTYTVNTNIKFVDSLDGFLNDAELIEDKPDGLGISAHEDKSEAGTSYALCIHTKNSAFDGLYTASEFVSEAKARGHSTIGIADLGSVQSFAEFSKSVKKAGMKGLYGTEIEIINHRPKILIGGFDDKWEDVGIRKGTEIGKGWDGKTFCIFDIETTGLFPYIDEIIQISVKKCQFTGIDTSLITPDIFKSKSKKLSLTDLKGLRIIETFDHYIKPEQPISPHVTELTHITQEKLDEDGEDVVEVLKEFKKFIKGSILVAHNGIEFDVPFINAHLRKHNLEEIEETTLDTLKLSHYLFAHLKFKSYALSALSKKASIEYAEDKAHNALYDVDVLVNLFFTFLIPKLYECEKLEVDSILTLNEYFINKGTENKSIWGGKSLIYIKNQEGVKELYKLVSLAHSTYYYDAVKLARHEITEEARKNLVLVSNPLGSELLEVFLKNDQELFKNVASWYDYVIIPPPSHFLHQISKKLMNAEDPKRIIRGMVELCDKLGIKWFFSGSIRYIDDLRDSERYSVLTNVKGISGKRHYLYSYIKEGYVLPKLEFKYTEQLLDEYRDIWEEEEYKSYVARSFEVQKEFIDSIDGDIEVIKDKLHPPKIDKCNDSLKELCNKRLHEKYGDKLDQFLLSRYEVEANALIENDFSVVYWVSYLLVKKSLEDGYLVGSRGSVGSSFVAYLMGISEVNPLPPHYYCQKCSYFDLQQEFTESGFDLPDKECPKCKKTMMKDGHDIPFETFLGFGGNKVPDIDLNFSGEYQIKAHDFLKEYFGEDKVFRAGTIGTMAEKTAVAVVEEYAGDAGRKFSKGKKMWLSDKIVDVKRTTGQHPGGILVVPGDRSIYEFSPTNYPANDLTSKWKTTHFSFEDLHDALLKFDILGHDDPTTLKILKHLTGVDPLTISFQSNELVDLYRSCECLGIKEGDLIGGETTGALALPEFGTISTRKIIKACQPRTFADLMRISGFSHGTGVWKGNIEKLVADKENYPLNKVITCRDDIMLYLLRQGLSREDAFNITESIRKGRGLSKEFEDLMREKGIPEWYIQSSKKISYIFPKAHATAYVMMSWKIAWYKKHYPLAFYSSYFSLSLDGFDWKTLVKNDPVEVKSAYQVIDKNLRTPSLRASVKVKDKHRLVIYEVAYEFLLRKFKFAKPCINKSDAELFVVNEENKELLIPLVAVDGLGLQYAKGVVEGRKKGIYRSIHDISTRGGLGNELISKLCESGILPKVSEVSEIIFDEYGNPQK